MPDDGEAKAGAGELVFAVFLQVIDRRVVAAGHECSSHDGYRQRSVEHFGADVYRCAV